MVPASQLARATVVAAVLVSTLAAPLPAQSRGPGWVRPVDGPVVERFRAPAGPYGAGHRGVDLAAAPGTPVRAAGRGQVVFAGDVGGSLHVVIDHGTELRTSYSFLADVAVRTGATVDAGQVVGTAGGAGPGHEPGVLHFGLRRGEEYLDPMRLFAPTDLGELVRLVPADGARRDAAWPHPEDVAGELGLDLGLVPDRVPPDDGCGTGIPIIGDAVSVVCDAVETAGDLVYTWLESGLDVLRQLGAEGAALAERLWEPLHDLLDAFVQHAEDALQRFVALSAALRHLIEIGERFLDWATRPCSDDAPPADGSGGSGNALVVVQGMNSSLTWTGRGARRRLEPHFDFDPGRLGYHPVDVHWFSYSPDGPTYEPADSYRDLEQSAGLLAEQLRALQRAQPTRPVDLIAHSQGGVVVDLFLQHYYRGHRDEYPPLGHVVTLATPHEGAPLATTVDQLRFMPHGRLFLEILRGFGAPVGKTSVHQLSAHHPVMRHLWDRPLPDGVDFTSIGGSLDVVVPANAIDVPGGRTAVVDVGGLLPTDDHSGIGRDPDTLRAMRAAIEGRPMPCTDFFDGLREAAAPVLITAAERSDVQ